MVTLLWLRQGISYLFLSWIFEVSVPTIWRCIQQCVMDLFRTFEQAISIPSYNERRETFYTYTGKKIAMVIDGVEQFILAPKDKILNRVSFSGKKRHHTLTKLIVIAPSGKIWFLSKSYFGSITDQNLASMPENSDLVSESEWIAADRGFKGLEYRRIITYRNRESFTYKLKFKKFRVIVENSIRQVKMWKVCQHTFPFKVGQLGKEVFLEWHHKIWVVCSGLVNLYQFPFRS
jgi:hypothetical protein